MRPVRIVLAVALLLCAAATLGQQQQDLYSQISPLEQAVSAGTATHDQQLQLARLYLQAGRDYESLKLADQVLANDPNDAAAKQLHDQANTALQSMMQTRVAAAEQKAARGTDQDRLDLANAYYDAGSYGLASDTYAKLPPSMLNADARLRYARSLAWSNRLDAAERQYAQLLTQSNDPALELEYGRVLSWMGSSHAAIARLTDAYNRNPSEDTVVALANAKAWSGDRAGAITLLDQYAAAHPGSQQAAQLSAQFKASPELALERVNRMLQATPYNLALQVEKARLQYAAGHYAEAIKTTDFVKAHATHNIEGLDQLRQDAEARRQAELAKLQPRLDALNAQGSTMASSSANADEMLSLAKAYVGLEDYDHAIALFDRYLRIRPNDTDARVQYARVLSWDRRYDQSAAQYRMLLNQDPGRADLRLEYGQVLSYESQYRDAMQELYAVTNLNGNPRASLYGDVPQQAYYNIGQIYRWYGWNEHDIAEQNQALALDAGYAPAHEELDLARHLRPASTLEGRYTYATDSDNFTLRRYDLTAEKWVSPRTAYDLGVGHHEFDYLGDTVSANVLNAGAQYRWSDRWTARGNVGINLYDQGIGTRPFFGIGAVTRPSLTSRAAFDFNHYDLVYDVFTLQSLTTPAVTPQFNLGSPISINDFRGHYDWNGGGLFSALADGSYGFISDSNHRAAAHGIAAFRVWKAPFIALKGEGHYLAYNFRSNRYWSPTSYHSLAAVLQVGQNIRDRFFWNVELKAGKAYESGFSSDIRAYEANVTVPLNDRFDLVGDYGYGKSGRINSIVAFSGADQLVNYWQRHFYVGVQVKRLFGHGERASHDYYYDRSVLAGATSPVIPPLGETH